MRIEGTPNYYSNSSKIALGVGALIGIFFVCYIAVIALFAAGTLTYASLFSGSIFNELSPEEDYLSDEYSLTLTPLMEAVSDGDEEKVNSLLI